MENKKVYPKDIGAIWIKESSNGEYLSIQVEINGVKHNFAAFKNRFYEVGGKKPAYTIPVPKSPLNEQNAAFNEHKTYQPPKSSIINNSEDIPF